MKCQVDAIQWGGVVAECFPCLREPARISGGGSSRIFPCLQKPARFNGALLHFQALPKGGRAPCPPSESATDMRIHSGDKPFKCDLCEFCFSDNSNLKRHLRIHTGEKLFKCDLCALCFARHSSFKRHLHTHTGGKHYNVTCVD